MHKLIAQVTGLIPGEFCFRIFDAHVYERHIEDLEKQINSPMHETPTLHINPNVTSFYKFKLEDITVTNYKNNGKIAYEIAI